jgi:hypothetical protein
MTRQEHRAAGFLIAFGLQFDGKTFSLSMTYNIFWLQLCIDQKARRDIAG